MVHIFFAQARTVYGLFFALLTSRRLQRSVVAEQQRKLATPDASSCAHYAGVTSCRRIRAARRRDWAEAWLDVRSELPRTYPTCHTSFYPTITRK